MRASKVGVTPPGIETEPFLSFIEVEPLRREALPNPSLKVELRFPQGHRLKLETEGDWGGVGELLKSLMR
jgi:hypothetical protein